MTTCDKCLKQFETECVCYKPREKLRRHTQLFERQLEVLEAVQFENKSLYMEIEESKVIKKAKIKKNNLYSITAFVKFSEKDFMKGTGIILKLLDWEKQTFLRRKEEKPKFSFFIKSVTYGWNVAAWSG